MKKNLLFVLLGGVVGAFISWVVFGQTSREAVPTACFTDYQEVRESGHTYIKPLLECDAFVMAPKLEALRSEIVTTLKSSGLEEETSLYFRDLNTGMWIGLQEDQKIAPASLSKVLNLMAVYRKSEQDPGFLDEEFLYADQFLYLRNLDTTEYQDKLLENGEKYTVRELVERMIKYSDNEASSSLQYILNKKYPVFLNSLQDEINVDYSGTISLKDYSNMFRMLYNASYLNRRNSELALDLLTKSEYREGIVAAIPDDISVASKFGFYDPLPDSDDEYRFNQCGIVYHPERPYLLCLSIASKTLPDFQSSIETAESLSSVIFNWVDNHGNALVAE